MNRKMKWAIGTVVGLMLSGCVAHAAEQEGMYSKLVCKGKKHPVCHVVKKEKISGDVQFLDMSEVEGKSDEFPVVTKKGGL